MRKIVLAFGLMLSASGMYTHAQMQRTEQQAPPSVQADFIQRLSDGSSRLTGKVVIVVNEIRITTDSGVFYPESNVVEITGGNAHIELPMSPTIQKSR